MDNTTVFSKTGKGLLEVKNRSNRITKEQYRVLSLVDGKANLDELAERARTNSAALRQVLSQLSDAGYIKVLVSSSSSDNALGSGAITGSYYVDDLDFTAVLGPASSSRPSIYQSTETERRQRDSAERKAAEAAATKRREEDEQRKRKEALRLAEEEAQARKLREDAQRKAQLEAQRQAKLESELKARLDADRLSKENAAKAARAEIEARLKADIDCKVRESAELRRREEEVRRKQEEHRNQEKEREERKHQEEIARKRLEEESKRAEEDLRRQEVKELMLKAEAERRRLEQERKRNEEEERKRKEEEEKKRQEDARRLQEEEERKRREEEERKRREDEERVRREENARRKKEEEDRKRREEDERKRREEEDRKRREEEARRKKEEEDRKLRDEEERERRDEQERVRLDEKARRKAEEDNRKRAEEEDHKRRDEEERKRRDDAARQLKEAQERKRREEEEHKRREEQERIRREEIAEQQRLEEEVRKRKAEKERRRREEEEVLALPPDRAGGGYEFSGDSERSLSGQSATDTLSTRLDLPEVIESEPPISTQISSLTQAAAGNITQDDIRRALEEQERRLRMEEETRAAFERAEREAQLKAEREAREMAEAAEQARKEAQSRAREESERLIREEKERRETEEQERRKNKETERRAREQARVEAERRKREEDLARQRKEQEERELRKTERDRIQKDLRRAHITPARVLLGGVFVLALLAALVIQFATLSPWAPDIERIASQRLGEPVHVGSLRATVFPRVQLILNRVTVGAAQDVRAASVTLVPEIGSLFSETKNLKAVEIQGLDIAADGLLRSNGWLKGGGAKPELVRVPLIKIKEATLDLPGVALPSVSALIKLSNEAEVLSISATTMDDRLQVDLVPRVSNVEVSIKGRNFTLPVGPALEVMDLQGTGTISAGELRMTRLEYFLYGGQGSAEATVRWQDGWTLESNFDFQRLSLETAMRAFRIQVISDGALDAKGIVRLRSPKLETLFQEPQIDASFTVRRGNLAGFDIPRALQQRHRDGVQGGKTRFEELTGNLMARDGIYQYRQVKMTAGVLKSGGQVDISPTGSVSGRISAELRSSAGVIRGNFTVSGNDQATMLKP